MTDLLTRLKDWETVYPCDLDKPLGNLYNESFDRITKAIKKLEEIDAWVKDTGLYAYPDHQPVPVFRDLPDLIKELKS